MALYLAPGSLKPSATREVVTGRYELCEDLATHLQELALAQHHGAGLPQDEVLRRCHRGLLAGPSGVSEPEAEWIVRRLAELAAWRAAGLAETG